MLNEEKKVIKKPLSKEEKETKSMPTLSSEKLQAENLFTENISQEEIPFEEDIPNFNEKDSSNSSTQEEDPSPEEESIEEPSPQEKLPEGNTPSQEEDPSPKEELPPEAESIEEPSPEEKLPESNTSAQKEAPSPEEEQASRAESIEEPSPEEHLPESNAPTQEEAPVPEEEHPPELEIAHVDFDLLDTEGRWLLKVISGPNTGAEFTMNADSIYFIGTDSKECDIIFQDLSVSRKHAKITIDKKDNAILEDLSSRNGTFIGGERIEKKTIAGNVLVSMGTTTFMLYDREAEHTTIVSPLSTKEKKEEHPTEPTPPKKEEPKKEEPPLKQIQEAALAPLQTEVDRVKEKELIAAKSTHAISSLVILAIVTGLLLIVGIGTTLLFRAEEVLSPKVADPEIEITRSLSAFPAVRFSYNPTNGRVMLIGHVLTVTDRSRLLDSLQQLKFIRGIDSGSVVIDELVWRELNQLLSKNPAWRGISLTSPTAGKYVVTGFLKTRNQSAELFDYLALNFPYMDLLEKKVIIEESLLGQVTKELSDAGFRGVTPSLSGGDLVLTGSIGQGTQERFQKLVLLFKSLPGIRNISLQVNEAGQKEAFVDLTKKYQVSGFAKNGNKSSVVINGKILAPGDILDGMMVINISSTSVLLEKDGVKYKIDFNQ